MRLSPLLILLAFALSMFSCRPVYNPNPVNIPLFSDGGEFQSALSISNSGYNLQTALSPVYPIGIIANGHLFRIQEDSVGSDNIFRNNFIEGGLGSYVRLAKYVRMGLYGGIGRGFVGNKDLKRVYNRFFIQPTFGMTSRNFDTGLATRFVRANYVSEETNSGKTETDDGAWMFEPALMVRAGREQVKFQLEAGYSIPMTDFSNPDIDNRNFIISLGLHLTFGLDFDRFD